MEADLKAAAGSAVVEPIYAVTVLEEDKPLVIRLDVTAPPHSQLKLPYYFAEKDTWRLKDATGSDIKYTGAKVKRRGASQGGWICIDAGQTHSFERIDLSKSFSIGDSSLPLSYFVNSHHCTISAHMESMDVGQVSSAHHRYFMEAAIREAEKSVASPKAYCVGCVIVPQGTAETLDSALKGEALSPANRKTASGSILATGFSREIPGNTHAEQCALIKMNESGLDSTGCDMYTTMEPCSKRLSGNIPCVSRCITHKIGRVFVGVREPAHFVRCEGVAQLIAAGIPCFDVVYPGVHDACLAPNSHIGASAAPTVAAVESTTSTEKQSH